MIGMRPLKSIHPEATAAAAGNAGRKESRGLSYKMNVPLDNLLFA